MVRDLINCSNCNISFRPQRISYSIKKIGSYIGKIKNTFSNFQREISSATQEIDLENESELKNNNNKKDIDKNG